MTYPITRLEKAALITTGAAAAFKTLLWSLEAGIDSTDPYISSLRVLFAFLSFVAFDLVIAAVVFRGWSVSGAAALLVAAAVSAAIALDVAKVLPAPALHAAPALTLAAFGIHLMLSRHTNATAPTSDAAPAAQPSAAATAAVQVNVAVPATPPALAAPLPRTIAQYIAARAAELPQYSQAQLAAELGTSADTVRRMLQLAATAAEPATE